MGKKQKCDACTTGWCKNHVFQLSPLDAQAYYRKKLKFRLCPKLSKNKVVFEKTTPHMNKDFKFYTPCFILEEEKKYYSDNDQKMLSTHNLKIENEPNDEQTILVAKHGRNKNYCSVCKADYEDYMSHMEDPTHKKFLRANKFTAYISEMQAQLRGLNVASPKQIFEPASSKIVEQTAQIDQNSKIVIDVQIERDSLLP